MSSSHPTYLAMICEAIIATPSGNKGVSRAAIANYVKDNYPDLPTLQNDGTGAFNAALRRALQSGLEKETLQSGTSSQRYKLTPDGRKLFKSTETRTRQKAAPKRKAGAKKKGGEKKKGAATTATGRKKAAAAAAAKKKKAGAASKKKGAKAKGKGRGRPSAVSAKKKKPGRTTRNSRTRS